MVSNSTDKNQINKIDCSNRNRKGVCLLVNKPCKKLTNNYQRYCLFYDIE